MFAECQKFLIEALKEAGIKTPPITSMKKLNVYSESHVGAVLFEEETLSRSGSKTIYRNERGDQQKRRRLLDRSLTFEVIIGEYTAEKAEKIYKDFLLNIEGGFYIDGNFTETEFLGADWVEKDDSILKAQVAVQVKVKFNGGMYRDTGYIDAKKKELAIRIERFSEKETDIYGKNTGAGDFTGTGGGERNDGL